MDITKFIQPHIRGTTPKVAYFFYIKTSTCVKMLSKLSVKLNINPFDGKLCIIFELCNMA